MALTELQVKNIKPSDKRFRILDEDCLYLEVLPSGNKSWRMRFFDDSREKLLTLGPYPDFSLKEAREWRNDTKKKASLGETPLTIKQKSEAKELTFSELFNKYMDTRVLPKMSESRIKSIRSKINLHVIPRIGNKITNEINEAILLGVLKAIEAQGTIETAHAVKGICGQIFRYGIAIGKCDRDPSAALKGALEPRNVKHRARVEGKENIGALMRSISVYKGFIVKSILLFEAYVFLRPGEVRSLEWSEVNLEKKRSRFLRRR